MRIPLQEMVKNHQFYGGQKSFMGLGVGPDGVPIDLLRVHFLGLALDDYTIFVADEFSSQRMVGNGLNDLDLEYATGKYREAFELFEKIWPSSRKIVYGSEIMNTDEYKKTFSIVKEKIRKLGLEGDLSEIDTELGKNAEDKRSYALNELAVIELFRKMKDITVKVGPPSEAKYDNLMKKLSRNINFLYLHPSHALTKDGEISPHMVDNIISIPNQRILITDDPVTVEDKLNLAHRKALTYFAIFGSLAGRANGSIVRSAEEIIALNDEELGDFAKEHVVYNIIAPIRKAKGIPIYKESPMRKIYDSTFKEAKVKFDGRIPNLGDAVRPQLNSLTELLIHLMAERQKYGFTPKIYNKSFPNLREANILPEIPSHIYVPFLRELCVEKGNQSSTPIGLDLELMSVLQRRILISYDVALSKIRTGKSVYDGEREKVVLNVAIEKGFKFDLKSWVTKKAFEVVIDQSKELQDIVISRYALDF